MSNNESSVVHNTTDDTFQQFESKKIIMSSFYWTISSIGLSLQAIVIAAVFRSQKHKSQLFYLFLVNLSVADSLLFLIYILVAAPCILVSDAQLHSYCQVYGRFTFILTSFESVLFIAMVYSNLVISFNRAMGIALGMSKLSIY